MLKTIVSNTNSDPYDKLGRNLNWMVAMTMTSLCRISELSELISKDQFIIMQFIIMYGFEDLCRN